MFEIIENKNKGVENQLPFNFLIDGKLIEDVHISENPFETNYLDEKSNIATIVEFRCKTHDLAEQLFEFAVEDFTRSIIKGSRNYKIGKLIFSDFENDKDFYWEVEIDVLYEQITFRINPFLAFWKKNYSFVEFQDTFFDYLNKKYRKELHNLEIHHGNIRTNDSSEINYYINHKFSRLNIAQELEPYFNAIKDSHKESLEFLDAQVSNIGIQNSFYFPENLKIPCEQYLLYFAQFLQDLGINATSKLTEEAGKVLFSVTPTDDQEALGKIREALAVYLSLSSNPIPNSTGDIKVDMVLSGARANAKHLESQLELAVAKLQFKEATLELKDATIGQNQLALRQKDETIKELQEIISRGNIFEESLEKVEINGEVIEATDLYRFSRGEDDDIEISATPILETANEDTKVGLVKFHDVTKLKEYGVSFDLPQAIRNLMKYFNRNKKS
jgi:hypothetical protein